jgi:hypothetical protein
MRRRIIPGTDEGSMFSTIDEDIPIRLIRLDMKLVGRNEVRNTFRGSVNANVYFYPSELVKYAILSHRWLDEGEPTFEEMKAGTAAGPGRVKVVAISLGSLQRLIALKAVIQSAVALIVKD